MRGTRIDFCDSSCGSAAADHRHLDPWSLARPDQRLHVFGKQEPP